MKAAEARRTLESVVPVGFCCGGFSSTAGYDHGNEAFGTNPEGDWQPAKVINLALAQDRFYPIPARRAWPCMVSAALVSLSASAGASMAWSIPPLRALTKGVTAPVPIPSPVCHP